MTTPEISAIDWKAIFGKIEIDPYPIPPIVYLSVPSGEINTILGYSTNKAERRYWAAAIILGQPFA